MNKNTIKHNLRLYTLFLNHVYTANHLVMVKKKKKKNTVLFSKKRQNQSFSTAPVRRL